MLESFIYAVKYLLKRGVFLNLCIIVTDVPSIWQLSQEQLVVFKVCSKMQCVSSL